MIAHLPQGPERVLGAIEPWFFEASSSAQYDRDLSLEIIGHLLPLLDAPLDHALESLNQYLASHQGLLKQYIQQYSHDATLRYALLAQPEGLLLFYLLDRDAFALRERWAQRWPIALLDALADIWGHPDPAA